jgi:glucan phosphoethanolaminetransferase (alkaline phosphatase superfamily)
MATERPPRDAKQVVRSILLALSATWLLLAAFMRVESDSPHEVIALLQRLAFGGALLAVALIDLRAFRWWWLVIALVVLIVVWTATGHPLFFLVGGI